MASPIGITVCRSDGVAELVQNNQVVANAPKVEPDINGRVYQRLGPDDAKEYDWRKKLGTALMNSLNEIEPGKIDTDKEYILKSLPEGYTLWIHSAPEGGSGPQKKKTRSDAYLYGHPLGQTKRFRSAEEFKPHLIWLVTDGEHLCLCKSCTRKGSRLTDAEVSAPKPAPNLVQPEPPPSLEQLLDGDPNVPYIYRPGELVWFNKGTAWGLAIISKRQINGLIPSYHLQPLSHPLRHCLSVTKSQDDLRPWLAWTLPRTTHPQIANFKYDAVPWERVLNGEFGPGDAEVDGSILAGKEINDSYTPFHPLAKKTTTPGEISYSGMFLGAEKIWVGEAVRLQVPNNEVVIMVVDAIVENDTTQIKTASLATVIGDIFSFVQRHLPTSYNDRKNWPTPNLPPRMAADLRWRNEQSFDKGRNIWSEWQLKESKAKRGLSAIKGRWYETRRLLPILRPGDFAKEVSEGETYDAGVWMNSRFDPINDNLTRKQSRRDTFGGAVPKDLNISLGLDESQSGVSLSNEKSVLTSSNKLINYNGQYISLGAKSETGGGLSTGIESQAGHQDFYSNTMQH